MDQESAIEILTLDLGGTDTKLALFKGTELVSLDVFNTHKDPKLLVEEICNSAKKICPNKPIALGVGAAGFWDENCILRQSINLPSLIGYPIWEEVSKDLNLPIFLKSDVELAVMGEAIYGLADKYYSVLYINMGTGFSGGLYKDGEVFTTPYSPTIRLSFMVQPELLGKAEISNPEDQNLQSIAVLSSTIVNLACILSPEIIIFGGGKIDSNWERLIEPAINNAKSYLDQVLVYKIKFDQSQIQYPTLYGARELVFRELSKYISQEAESLQ